MVSSDPAPPLPFWKASCNSPVRCRRLRCRASRYAAIREVVLTVPMFHSGMDASQTSIDIERSERYAWNLEAFEPPTSGVDRHHAAFNGWQCYVPFVRGCRLVQAGTGRLSGLCQWQLAQADADGSQRPHFAERPAGWAAVFRFSSVTRWSRL